MAAVLHRPCPVCASRTLETLAPVSLPQPSGSPLPKGYRLVACSACDFAFADTPAPQSAYDLYYQTLAKYGGPTGTGAGQNPADQLRLEQLATRIETWLPGPEARLLDLGCGAGGLLGALAARGYTCIEGLDPDPAAVVTAHGHGLVVQEGLLSDAPAHYAGRRFDMIVLSHVAEHLRDLDWLPQLAGLLAAGGALYVEVPDPRGYRCGPRPPFYYFDSEHINHFSPQALARLFTSADLSPSAFIDCTLALADGTAYPAFAGVARAVPASSMPNGGPDMLDALRAYIADSARRAADSITITPALDPSVPLLVWGAGSWAQRLLGQNAIPLEQVAAFLDGAPNKQGHLFAGKPVVAPAEGLSRHPKAQVLVCVAVNPHQIAAEISRIEPGHTRNLHFITERP
jgi:SAM-dependent methyltransferase